MKGNVIQMNTLHLNSVRLNGIGKVQSVSLKGGSTEDPVFPPVEPPVEPTPTYTLSASVTNGKVSAKRNGSAVSLPYTANEGDTIVLSVTPNDGYAFEGWNDGNTDNPRTITMNADVALSAQCVEVVQPPVGNYIQFEDAEVERVLMSKGVSSDGVGITKEDAAKVTSISTWFKGNTEITSFNELEHFTGVTKLATDAFNGCTALASVNLVNIISLKNVYGVFYKTALGGDINMPNVTGEIGYPGVSSAGVFQGTNIERVLSLGSATSLANGYNASWGGNFQNCKSLKIVNLPETLENIGDYSFYDCTALVAVNIPDSVTVIGVEAFRNCPLNEVSARMLGVKTIRRTAFSGSQLRGELYLPSLTTLGVLEYSSGAFRGTKITKVLSLGSLTELPDGYNTNTLGTFSLCLELAEVTLPATLTKVGKYTFYGCSALATVICEATTPPALSSTNAFTNTPIAQGTGVIYVPDASLEAYKGATNWNQYSDRIKPLSEYVKE